MAHLHLVSVHPFRDGNGRISRIVQSLVLAREGLLAPEFVSIEEYLGRNTEAYYATLAEGPGRAYQPERDATAMGGVLRRRRTSSRPAGGSINSSRPGSLVLLEDLVDGRSWPDRLVIALEQSLFNGVDRASYTAEAGRFGADRQQRPSAAARRGPRRAARQGRNTRYFASDALREDLERRLAADLRRA